MRPNRGGGFSFPIRLLPLFAVLFLLPNAIWAQFRFQDTIFDPTPQGDPLRKVFGIWGRLLNRMAQQGPPSDDELHLKGANEGGEGADNSLGEEAMPPGMARGGDRTKSVGADRIISEGRLNEILPRIFTNNQPSTTTTTTTTESTTTTTSTLTTMTSTIPPSTTTSEAESSTASNGVKETTTSKKKAKRRKKKPAAKSTAESTETTTIENEGTTSEAPSSPSSPSSISTTEKNKTIPPMSILKDEEEEGRQQKAESTQVIGATIRLRTNVERWNKGVEELPVAQSQGIAQNGGANLSDSMLTRMENETAQLIAEIENVLADAQIGPNGGHWLRESGENNSTTIEAKIETSTGKGGDEENEGEEDGGNEGEDGEEEEESGESEESLLEAKNTTKPPLEAKSNGTEATTMGRKIKIALPEAEEEEQAAEIAQLQLDSTVAISTASPTPISSTTTPNASLQSAQNIFNLNTNANANSNPNFSTMIRPINSVIDGIGPLILPLIGYSRQAFDAYAPYTLQRTEGVSIFRPTDFAGQPSAPNAGPFSQQSQQLVPFHQSGVPIAQPRQQMPIPLPHPRQFHSAQQSTQFIPQQMPDPPSLELLGRIIEQRRQRERERMRLQEVNGSFPPNAEQNYYPPVLDNGIQPSDPIPIRPPLAPTTTTTIVPAEDRGYDAGRKSVLNTFQEDSGLMLGGQQPNAGEPQKNGKEETGLGPSIGGGGGFGGGRRPNGAPFAFIQ